MNEVVCRTCYSRLMAANLAVIRHSERIRVLSALVGNTHPEEFRKVVRQVQIEQMRAVQSWNEYLAHTHEHFPGKNAPQAQTIPAIDATHAGLRRHSQNGRVREASERWKTSSEIAQLIADVLCRAGFNAMILQPPTLDSAYTD